MIPRVTVLPHLVLLLAAPLAAQAPAARALADVQVLADDALGGRLTGTAGADSASRFIARRFAEVGLREPAGGWLQPFTVSRDAPALAHAGLGDLAAANVVGLLPGRDRALRDDWVIVGAHYDHLGPGRFGALDPDSAGAVHNGADDNASGTAALIEIARQLALTGTRRSVAFVAFSGEELGLLGSAAFVKRPAIPLARAVAMLNLDMVGRLKENRLIVYGVETARELRGIVDSVNVLAGFDLKAQGDGYGPSDHASFYAAKLPVLHLFTDLHEDYHRATDDWPKINADGLMRVATYAAQVTRALADRTAPLTFVDLPRPQPAAVASGTSGRSGYGAYLGSIPDMSGNPGGVRLTGVRAGSPAEKGGLRTADIITQIGDFGVADLQAMTDALRAHSPGDVVPVVIVRDGQRLTLSITLGSRGG